MRQLPPQRLQELLQDADLTQCKAGEPIILQGQSARNFYIILKGQLDVRVKLAATVARNVRQQTSSRDILAGKAGKGVGTVTGGSASWKIAERKIHNELANSREAREAARAVATAEAAEAGAAGTNEKKTDDPNEETKTAKARSPHALSASSPSSSSGIISVQEFRDVNDNTHHHHHHLDDLSLMITGSGAVGAGGSCGSGSGGGNSNCRRKSALNKINDSGSNRRGGRHSRTGGSRDRDRNSRSSSSSRKSRIKAGGSGGGGGGEGGGGGHGAGRKSVESSSAARRTLSSQKKAGSFFDEWYGATMAQLSVGDSFGEKGLLMLEAGTRMASVVATSPCLLMRVDQELYKRTFAKVKEMVYQPEAKVAHLFEGGIGGGKGNAGAGGKKSGDGHGENGAVEGGSSLETTVETLVSRRRIVVGVGDDVVCVRVSYDSSL